MVQYKEVKNRTVYLQNLHYIIFQKKEKKRMAKWVCNVCGYVYEGDELPEDYECPLCGVGADQFEEEQ